MQTQTFILYTINHLTALVVIEQFHTTRTNELVLQICNAGGEKLEIRPNSSLLIRELA